MRSGSILLPGGSSGQDARTTLGFKIDISDNGVGTIHELCLPRISDNA
jgi:hypothetical protein